MRPARVMKRRDSSGRDEHDAGSRSPRRAPAALYAILRFIARHVRGFWAAIAAFLTVSLIAAIVTAFAFGVFADIVREGATQPFDEAVLRWFEMRRSPALDDFMLHVTSLGDGVVLIMLVLVSAVFLWLTDHRWSVYILLVGMIGGKLLNTLLKAAFDRTRPSVVDWVYEVTSPSFPSGHAMGAFITYGTVAYLVARLEPTPTLRHATWFLASVIILAIGLSRVYLGVHYPSDVLAGFLAGFAWLAFVASSVRALQFFASRRPATAREEQHLTSRPE